jgi:hypothetical protein
VIALLFPGQGEENFCIEQDETSTYFLEKTKTVTGFDLTKINLNDNGTALSQLQIFVASLNKIY